MTRPANERNPPVFMHKTRPPTWAPFSKTASQRVAPAEGSQKVAQNDTTGSAGHGSPVMETADDYFDVCLIHLLKLQDEEDLLG